MVRIGSTPRIAWRALRGARIGIDSVDEATIVMLAARRKLVSAFGPVQRAADAPVRDTER
ncbi:MAG TPA: hypothetical protein VGD42_20600 [Lysobacter sp.]